MTSVVYSNYNHTSASGSIPAGLVASDVLVVIATSGRTPPRTAVSVVGAGATWSKVFTSADGRRSVWLGTNPTSTVTMNVTWDGGTAIAESMFYVVRGLPSTAITVSDQVDAPTAAQNASPGQAVLAYLARNTWPDAETTPPGVTAPAADGAWSAGGGWHGPVASGGFLGGAFACPTTTGTFKAFGAVTVGANTQVLIGPSLAPDAPTALKVTAKTSTSLTVAWTPASGGIAPTGYEYRIDGGTPVGFTVTSSRTITGLTNDTVYNVEVRAKNNEASSAWVSVSKKTLAVEIQRYYLGDNSNATQAQPVVAASAAWHTLQPAGSSDNLSRKRLATSKLNLIVNGRTAAKPSTLPNSTLMWQQRTPALTPGSIQGFFKTVFGYSFIGVWSVRCIVRHVAADGTIKNTIADVTKAGTDSSSYYSKTLEGSIPDLLAVDGDFLLFEFGGAITSGLGGSCGMTGQDVTTGIANADMAYTDGVVVPSTTAKLTPWIEVHRDIPAINISAYVGSVQVDAMYLGETPVDSLPVG